MLGRRRTAPRRRILDTETEVGQQWLLLDWERREKVLEVRYDAINRHIGLSANDLDNFFCSHSIILGLEGAFSFNWEHVKVVITPTEVLLNTDYPSITPLVHELRAWILQAFPSSDVDPVHQGSFSSNPDQVALNIVPPFEFKILDFFLKTVFGKLDDEVKTIERETHSILDQTIFQSCTFGICDPKMEVIDEIKHQLGNLTASIQKVSDELEQLKGDDNRKTMMCLTEMLEQQISPTDSFRTARDIDTGGPSDRQSKSLDVMGLEMLLNSYLRQNIETSNKLSMVKRYVDTSQSRIIGNRDRRNNNFITVTVVVAIGGLGFSLFSYFHSK